MKMSEKKVKIKMNVGGIEVEIEAAPDLIGQAISQVINSLHEAQHQHVEKSFLPTSCKEALELLWKEGWFSVERRLSDVWHELNRRGYNFDRSAIAHALHDLTKEGILTRMGKARRYKYIQKIPAIISSNNL